VLDDFPPTPAGWSRESARASGHSTTSPGRTQGLAITDRVLKALPHQKTSIESRPRARPRARELDSLAAQPTRFQLRRPREREGGVCCKPELDSAVRVAFAKTRVRFAEAGSESAPALAMNRLQRVSDDLNNHSNYSNQRTEEKERP
jgi:hypothetical protein